MSTVVLRSHLLFGDFGEVITSGRTEAGGILASVGPSVLTARPQENAWPSHAAAHDRHPAPAHVRAPSGPATPRAKAAPTTPRMTPRAPVRRPVEHARPLRALSPRPEPKPEPATPAAPAIGTYDFARHSALGQTPGMPMPAAPPSHADLARQAEADARRRRFAFSQRVNSGGSIADPRQAPAPVAPLRRGPAGPPAPSPIGPMAPIGLRGERIIPQASTPHVDRAPAAVDGGIRNAEHYTAENARALKAAAARLQVPPEHLAQVIAHETIGTFSPRIWGGAGGRYMGLIQFGPGERRQYSANDRQSFREQIGASERFLLGRGFKPGRMDQMDLYSTVLAGSPGRYKARDSNASVEQHVAAMRRRWKHRVEQFLGADALPSGATPATAATRTTTARR